MVSSIYSAHHETPPSPIRAGGVATEWWWIRHAPVRDRSRIYGQADVESDCTNSTVFRALSKSLPADAIWITSNLKRARQTALAILRESGKRHVAINPIEISTFAEQNLGDWQGLDRAQFDSSRELSPHKFWVAPADERPPGGESFNDLVDRVRPEINRLIADYRGKKIVVIAHGGTIRAALAVALSIAPETALAFEIANCSITQLSHIEVEGSNSFWKVETVNHRPRLHGSMT